MKSILLTIVATLVLTACTPASPATTSPHGGGHMQSNNSQKHELKLQDQSNEREIAFSILDGENVFTDYGVSHTKEMHLIVVRDDLRHFQHLHPERDSVGVWRVAFAAPAGGTYWSYADFVDYEQNPYTIQFDKEYTGDIGSYGIAKDSETVKTVDGYRFRIRPVTSRDEVTFTYDIIDNQGKPVQLEQYLGARGHSVLISPSGDFIHTHASEEGDMAVFATSMPSDEFYRAFTQFQIKGKVITINFDWQQ